MTISDTLRTIACRPFAMLAVLGALVLAGAGVRNARAERFDHGGIERTYQIFVPPGLALPAPAIFVLHGGGGEAAQIRRMAGFDALAVRAGFVAVYPQGEGRQWSDDRNAPTVLSNIGKPAVDDKDFLTALAAHLVATQTARPERIAVAGISNGGMMALSLACDPDSARTFNAFIPVIANLPAPAKDACAPGRPVPVLIMNGTEDLLIPIDGGPVAPMFFGDRGSVLSLDETLSVLGRVNGCTLPLDDVAEPRDVGNGITLHARRADGCRAGGALDLMLFQGMGHRWPGGGWLPPRMRPIRGEAPDGFPVAEVIWSFASRFILTP